MYVESCMSQDVVATVRGPICRTRNLYLQYSRDIGQAGVVEADRGKPGGFL
jgi:hypothetical protein